MSARPQAAPSIPGVEWLIDNALAYDALLEAIAGARASVWISQLAFDADCTAHGSGIADHSAGVGRVLVEALLDAARVRGVDVRILLNASLLLDTAKPLRVYLDRAGAHRIAVRGVGRFPQLLHAKMVIVDENQAFLVGSPFVNGYWDDDCHQPVDGRRPLRELGGRPLHDVSTRLSGVAAEDLADVFAQLWNEAATDSAGDDIVRRNAPRAAGRDGAARIVTTAPRRVSSPDSEGSTEILAELLHGLASARSLVYIEHQYLSARPVIDAIASALELAPRLEVVVVLNQNPDVTAYRDWQNDRLQRAELLDHPRVGLFTLWSVARDATRSGVRQLNQIFVHSKVVTVDDRWATVGSANLDGVSLHSYGDDFRGRLGRRIFRDVRNFDVNVVLGSTHGPASHVVRDLRARLWREHLGTHTQAVRGESGSLAIWRAAARSSIELLNADSNENPSGLADTLVLPYSTRPTPARQLAHVGVRLDTRRVDLRFDPGWLEVNFSPNWVRNMFA